MAPRPGGRAALLRSAALAAVAAGPRPSFAGMPQAYSPDNDLLNQDIFVQYFGEHYYQDRFEGLLPPAQQAELRQLATLARESPVLALAAAQALYMYGWYAVGPAKVGGTTGNNATGNATGDASTENAMVVDWANVAAAAELFELSAKHGACGDPDLPVEEFLDARSCDTRLSHALFLHELLARVHREERRDFAQAAAYDEKASALLRVILQTPRYRGECCRHWKRALDFNFNAPFFPGVLSAPVWPRRLREQVPLVRFLEEHYDTIQRELSPLLDVPREAWTDQQPGSVTAEHLATKGNWFMLAVVRHGAWNAVLCQLAPQTCELLGSRPEIRNCSLSNINIMRLAPGASLKPHFGNAPRLAAHLPLRAPEPQAAWMSVGIEQTTWKEGQVVLFDDTYVHAVTHTGRLPRYVLALWFCHPCDENPAHAHGQACVS